MLQNLRHKRVCGKDCVTTFAVNANGFTIIMACRGNHKIRKNLQSQSIDILHYDKDITNLLCNYLVVCVIRHEC